MHAVVNPAWVASQVAAPGAPLAPSRVTSITVDGGATVSWVNPGGPPATSYTVTPYIAGVAQSTTTISAPAASASVTGLANLTAYTFSVHASNASGPSAESAQSGSNTPRLNLIFGDEFNGSFLDPAWAAETRDGDQSAPETQYYLPARVSLDGSSNLVIHAQSGSVTLPGYSDTNPPTYAGSNVTRAYTSGAVQWKSFSFTYGKIQVSAQVPNVSGGWAAVWMLGAQCEQTTLYNPDNVGTCNWPSTGSEEIDIAEYTGAGSPTTYTWTGNFNGGAVAGPTSTPVTNPSTTFNTYEADWSSGTISWFTNGVAVSGTQPYSNAAVPSAPMFLILANAMRGAVTLTQPVLSVDWVRVFHN